MGAQFGDRVGGIRRRIGLALDAFEATYQATFVRHLRRCCEERRLELIVVPGGILASTERGAMYRNPMYDLVGCGPLDGLIVLSSTLAPVVGKDGIARFCRSFGQLPVCSVGAQVLGISSICVDNAAGMRSLVDHLVTQHDLRRIAFIRGPEANEEAEARYEAYREALAAHGIQPDDAYATVGDFLPESGKQAVHTLLSVRQLEVDAVIGANDYMAIGAMDAIAGHPQRPTRLAIAGFDNVDEAHFAAPALTTVEQPFEQMAEAALRCVLDQLQGAAVDEVQLFQPRLLVRRSCGCQGPVKTPTSAAPQAKSARYELNFAQRRDQISAQMCRAARGQITGVKGWEERLLDGFVAELRGVPGDLFLSALESTLQTVSRSGGEVWRMHNVITELRRHALACIAEHEEERTRAEDMLQLARTLVGDAIARTQAQLRLSLENWDRLLNECGTRLAECEDAQCLREALSRELPRLGLRRCYVVLYEGEGVTETARVFHSLDPADQYKHSANQPYPAPHLLPDDLWLAGHCVNWVLLPLFFRGTSLGFAMLELCFPNGSYAETLRAHLSVALWSVLCGPKVVRTSTSGTLRLSGEDEVEHAIARFRQRETLAPSA